MEDVDDDADEAEDSQRRHRDEENGPDQVRSPCLAVVAVAAFGTSDVREHRRAVEAAPCGPLHLFRSRFTAPRTGLVLRFHPDPIVLVIAVAIVFVVIIAAGSRLAAVPPGFLDTFV